MFFLGLSAETVASINSTLLNSDTLFFEKGSTWKYLDDGSNQETEWKKIDFDDSQWNIGDGHFGFGEGDETTLLTEGFVTYYFRKKVNIDNINQFNNIYFNIVHDDGAVVYVNGEEVARSSLMPSGNITYLTGTTTYIPNDVENDFWNYRINKSFFHNGENVIAIEIHNQYFGSSDVSFDCYISDTSLIDYKVDGPYVFYRNNEIVVKTIEPSGPITYKYQNPEDVVLTCRFKNGVDTFNVKLQPELSIEDSEYPLPSKFLAISDIEGNLEAFTMLLKDAGVMDNKFDWTFGDGHLFFVGDMFDRGKNVTECLWLLYKLEYQAKEQGGKIHFILGNHDIMNLIFDFRYVAQKYITNSELLGETLESVYARDTELGRWLRTKNVIEKAGSFIFVHAGLSPELNELNLTYDEINYWGRYEMDSNCNSYDCNIINGGSDYGIYWYRGMAYEDLTQEEVDTIVSNFNGETVVIGHTVFDNISLLYEDKVACIDLDHEDNFIHGFMSALYYEAGNLYDFHTDGENPTFTLLKTINGIDNPFQKSDELKVEIFPHPVKSSATFKYTVPKIVGNSAISNIASLKIFNALGSNIKNYRFNNDASDSYYFEFNRNELKAGIYYYQLSVGELYDSGKILLID
jgi:Calcineurin-like phosphoesterase